MHREEAIVEFFRTRLEEEVQQLGTTPEVEADRKLLKRYDHCLKIYNECQSPYPCGNDDLSKSMQEYEEYVFPARIDRFFDHPAYAPLTADQWVAEDYLAARDAAKNPGQEQG